MQQRRCSFRQALSLINDRAVRASTSLEIVAIAILVGDIRFD